MILGQQQTGAANFLWLHSFLSLAHKKQLRFKVKNFCLTTCTCSSTDIILCLELVVTELVVENFCCFNFLPG